MHEYAYPGKCIKLSKNYTTNAMKTFHEQLHTNKSE